MTVEQVSNISDLDENRPQGGDRIADGDDHIRAIKKAVKTTFPNVTGTVNASHEEMNYLVGLTEPIKDTITGGADDLTALTLRVDANETAINDQKIGDHADVDLTGVEAGMVLAWDGTKWTPVRAGGGSMIKAITQPNTAGNFSVDHVRQTYEAKITNGTQTVRLSVPNGMVFAFEYFYGITSGSGSGVPAPIIRVPLGGLWIDGKPFYSSSTTNIEYDENGGHVWPGDDKSSIIRVEEYIEFKNVYSSIYDNRQGANLHVAGIFTEA